MTPSKKPRKIRHFRQSFATRRGPEFAEAYAKDLDMHRFNRRPSQVWAVQVNEPFTLDTLEGKMTGESGDYLLIGTAGEQYIIKEFLFKQLYEEVP